VRGDGTIDDKEIAILEGIAAWMGINKESIFDTRPWKVFGEGPVAEERNPMNGPGFNEGKSAFTAQDIRFNQKENVLYVTVLGAPAEPISIKSLGESAYSGKIKEIEILGSKEKLLWKLYPDSLVIQKPTTAPNDIAVVFKIQMK
jgi:alpha-L-fucosidase